MPHRPPVFRPAHSPVSNRRRYDQERGSPTQRGYGADWKRVRDAVLAEEPLCRFCAAEGQTVAATEVDHIETIRDRPDLRLTRSNLRPLCTPCHSSRTARDLAALRRTAS